MKCLSIIFGIVVACGMLAVSATAGPNCTCRFNGKNFKTGAIMCIRGKLSKCDFVLNNTSWKVIADTCPQAQQNRKPDTMKVAAVFAAKICRPVDVKISLPENG